MPRSMNLYLAHLEFICGEYTQNFHLCVQAQSIKKAEKILRNHLRQYYPDPEIEDQRDWVFHYHRDQVIITYTKIDKIPASRRKALQLLTDTLSI